MSAYNLLVASSISMIILIKVSSPLNMKRKILCIVCGVVLVGGVLFFGDFFQRHHYFPVAYDFCDSGGRHHLPDDERFYGNDAPAHFHPA